MAPHRAPYLASGHGQPTIGKTFNGQAKDLLWLTWRSYAGPPQYYIPPEGGALNPSGRRQPVPDRTLGAQGRQARRLPQPSPAGRQPFERSEVGLFSDGRKPGCPIFAAKGGIKNGARKGAVPRQRSDTT